MGRAPRAVVLVVGTGLLVAGALVFPPPAAASCHYFTVDVSPSRAGEGTSVTVTVRRDGNDAPSQVDVSTADGTAKANTDYTPLQQQTVSFIGAEIEKTFSVPVLDDGASEPDETFRVRLSNPGGCTYGSYLSVGPDATVTITGDQQAPPSSGTTTPTTAAPSSQSQGGDSGSHGGTTSSSPTGGAKGGATGTGDGTGGGTGADGGDVSGNAGTSGSGGTGANSPITFGGETTTTLGILATGDDSGPVADDSMGITGTGDEAANLSVAGDDAGDGVPAALVGLAILGLAAVAAALAGYGWLFRWT